MSARETKENLKEEWATGEKIFAKITKNNQRVNIPNKEFHKISKKEI